jgi:hypothetical protein
MTMARAHLVDVTVTRWYHCVTRCVRRALLLAEGTCNRKEWIEKRLEELSQIFAISVGGFSVLDNHLHVLVRLDSDIATGWSDEARKNQSGSARSKIGASSIPPVKGCSKDSHSEAT